MDLNPENREIEQFLYDVRNHFIASLETSQYENASNLFHVTEAEATEKLLQRCEKLLEHCTSQKSVNGLAVTISSCGAGGGTKGDCTDARYKSSPAIISNGGATTTATTGGMTTAFDFNMKSSTQKSTAKAGDGFYLDMTGNSKKKSSSAEYIEFNSSIDSDKTFRCFTQKARNSLITTDEEEQTSEEENNSAYNKGDDDTQIYDICHVSQLDDAAERQKAITPDLELMQNIECPYQNLPLRSLQFNALAPKFGQLQRVEKRLFFDQSKKYTCGILNDWLLCYADAAQHPTITLYLKTHGIEIEHSGEGKRREICFQITTADPNKKFIFQAHNEVDAKEWIHAIEAAIRGDSLGAKNMRKLPTPPTLKRMTFIGGSSSSTNSSNSHSFSCNGNANGNDVHKDNTSHHSDYIYEEPSPLYDGPTQLLFSTDKVPEEPLSSNELALQFEYDIPKCPAKPLKSIAMQNDLESEDLLHLGKEKPIATATSPTKTPTTLTTAFNEATNAAFLDFQNKVKDVHSKLSSQLSSPDRLKKSAKKTYSACSSNDTDPPNSVSTSPASLKEQKKQKKSNTPIASPQKPNALIGTTNGAGTAEKSSAKNWFLNRLNRTTSSMRSSTSPVTTPTTSPTGKGKLSEKENLLNSLDLCDGFENNNGGNIGQASNNSSPILKGGSGGKSKVNMIINQFEASGHFAMFGMETLANNAVASLSSFCDSSDCNNYEPIMTVSSSPNSFMKKV